VIHGCKPIQRWGTSELGATVSVGSMILENKITQIRIEKQNSKIGLNINVHGNATGPYPRHKVRGELCKSSADRLA